MPAPASPKKSPAAKFIVIGCVVLALIAGVGAAIFFGIKYAFKNSDAAKAAVLALKQSNNVRAVLGDITDIGTPMGNIRTNAGGSGSASLSASVIGTKASGRYYATLIRQNGQWFLTSGRVQLDDGRSVILEASGVARTLDVPGAARLLTISDVGGRRVATWKALVPADGTHKSMDISLGAQSGEFERLEPTFVEILDSFN